MTDNIVRNMSGLYDNASLDQDEDPGSLTNTTSNNPLMEVYKIMIPVSIFSNIVFILSIYCLTFPVTHK